MLQFNVEGKCVHVPYTEQLPVNRLEVVFFVVAVLANVMILMLVTMLVLVDMLGCARSDRVPPATSRASTSRNLMVKSLLGTASGAIHSTMWL